MTKHKLGIAIRNRRKFLKITQKELSEIEKQLKAKLEDNQIQDLIKRHTILKQILIKISMLIGNRTI